MRALRARLFAVVAVLLFVVPSIASADRVIQNDSVGENVNNVTASAEIIAGEMYEAVFDIPTEWLEETTGRPLYWVGVRVLMVNGPNSGQNYCGRFSVEIWEEPPGVPQVQSDCTLIDPNTFQVYNGKHKDPGALIFSAEDATMGVPNGPLGFVVQGQPNMGQANLQDLNFAALNMNQGVNLSPVKIDTNRVRVGIKAMDLACTGGTQGQAFPIMVSDFDGVAGPGRNYIYGREPTVCPTTRHYTWEDFGPAFGMSTPGDWIIRLVVSFNQNATMDMGMEIDASTVDMSSDMTEDIGNPVDMTTGPDMSGTDMPTSSDAGDISTSRDMSDGMGAALLVESISPSTTANTSSTDVVILGEGFEPGIEVLLGADAIGVRTTVSERIEATVPEGLDPGTYDLIVTNPDGESDSLAMAFTVTDDNGATDSGGVEEGCGCAASQMNARSHAPVLLLLLVALMWSRRRRST